MPIAQNKRLRYGLTQTLLARFSIAAVLLFLGAVTVNAQFMRLGIFDLEAEANAAGVYSSNIDGVRPSETTNSMTDYFIVAGIRLTAIGNVSRDITLKSSLSLRKEHHFIRDDLNDRDLSNPLGSFAIDTDARFGYYTLRFVYSHDSTYDKKEGQVVTGAEQKRTYRRTDDGLVGLEWRRKRVWLRTDVRAGQDRYQEDEFQIGDEDKKGWSASANWQATRRIRAFYNFARDQTDLINQPDSYTGWDETEAVGLVFRVLDRPTFDYSLSLKREIQQGEEIDWQPSQTFTLSDVLTITRKLSLSGDASYTLQEQRGVNDIAFVYSFQLIHDISRTALQRLTFRREPADTFGVTTKTDTTTVGYRFDKLDLFIYNLNLYLGVDYDINRPLGNEEAETERRWLYEAGLMWTRRLSRKITRVLSYGFHLEDSNLYDENLQEHRVTLSYTYVF